MKNYELIQLREGSVIFRNNNHRKLVSLKELGLKQTTSFRTRKTYTGTITKNSRKRIKKSINLMLQLSPKISVYNPISKANVNFRLSFITLTIPALESAVNPKETYKLLLRPFIQWLTKTQKVSEYIWKLELQERGAIHYHLTINKFIEYWKIRDKWNNLMRKNNMLDGYFSKHKSYNPNSTDVHNVKEVQDMAAYLEKYVAKNEQNQKELHCKIWDCSFNLKAGRLFELTPSHQNIKSINRYLTDEKTRIIEEEHFGIIFNNSITPHKILFGYEHLMYNEWLSKLKHLIKSPPAAATKKQTNKNHKITKQISLEFNNSNNIFEQILII